MVVLSISMKEYSEEYKPVTRTEPPTFCLYCLSAPRHFTKKVAYIIFLCTAFSLADCTVRNLTQCRKVKLTPEL